MKYLIPNFAFEDELCQPNSQLSSGTQQAVQDLAPLMGLMASPEDVVVVPKGAMPDDIPQLMQGARFCEEASVSQLVDGDCIVPWGWTKKARTFSVDRGIRSDQIPEIAAVKFVNSRSFNANFDVVIRQNSTRHSFGQLCHSMDELQRVVRRLQTDGYDRWVAKPQISHAGRNRLIVTGCELNSQQNGWLNKRLQDGVYLEPWVEVFAEHSLQFDVPAKNSDAAAPQLVGVTQLLNDGVGRYAGNLLLSSNQTPELAPVIEHGHLVCQQAQAAGYFGPIGIDSFRFVDATGNTGFRVCNDINARFTMGRLALNFSQYVPASESGAWCRFSQRKTGNSVNEVADPEETARNMLVDAGFKDVSIVRTSPLSIGGSPVATTTLLLKGGLTMDVLKAQQVLHSEWQKATLKTIDHDRNVKH